MISVCIERARIVDLLSESETVRETRGESLARKMITVLREEQAEWERLQLNAAVIEEQPGLSVRSVMGGGGGGGGGIAHSLKMNNLSYVILTWLLEHSDTVARDVAFRSTKRKDVVMSMLPDSVHAGPTRKRKAGEGDDIINAEDRAAFEAATENAAAAAAAAGTTPSDRASIVEKPSYNARKHDSNKDISVATLRRCLDNTVPFQLKPAIARAFTRHMSRLTPPSRIAFSTGDDLVRNSFLAKGKVDDICDATWLAIAVALERFALIEKPSHVEREEYERGIVNARTAGVRVLAFDVGVRNLAFAIVHVTYVSV